MNTKTTIYILIAIVAFGASYFYLSPQDIPTQVPSTETSVTTVSITNFSFNPGTITINKGDVVIWNNNDSAPHQIVGGDLNGQVMNKNQNYMFTFNTTGTFDYHCALHPSMKGVVIVQ